MQLVGERWEGEKVVEMMRVVDAALGERGFCTAGRGVLISPMDKTPLYIVSVHHPSSPRSQDIVALGVHIRLSRFRVYPGRNRYPKAHVRDGVRGLSGTVKVAGC
ncbi:hypothetical protein BDM02DRAFT_3121832 [Thelephora ganbajun]|uniref:Uncharacterized protein n=1 Tax=Thelephora ganbajun TaxID=370292 RepID=A0ACB6Z5A9_THEGA|nr:hypothetical protein BDM02DRAFT_3121832 [Thelephora ganbajun]